MMHTMKFNFAYLSIAFGILLCLPTATFALAVPVEFHADGIERASEPVTFGVPIAQSENITSVDDFVVLNSEGSVVNAQFVVTERWGSGATDTTKPIRWMLVDTQVTASSTETVTYTITNESALSNSSDGIVLNTTADAYSINTGAATFVLDKQNFNGFDSVTLSDDTNIIDSSAADGLRITDSSANDYYAADYPVNDPNQNGTPNEATEQPEVEQEYQADGAYSYPGYQYGSEIIRNGSQRVRVRYHGKISENFTDESAVSTDEQTAVDGNPYAPYDAAEKNNTDDVEYTIDIDFFADSGFVKIYFTLENNNSCLIGSSWTCVNHGSLNSIQFEDASWLLTPNLNTTGLQYTVSGESTNYSGSINASQSVKLYQDSSGTTQWDYYTADADNAPRMNYYVQNQPFEYSVDSVAQATTGTQAVGWLAATDGAHGVAVGIQDFWENFPNALELDTATPQPTMRLGFFPNEYATNHRLRAGEHKTHELSMYFYSAGQTAPAIVMGQFHEPLVPTLPAEYYADTYALGYIVPFVGAEGDTNYDAWSDYQVYNAGIIDSAVSSYYKTLGGDVWDSLDLIPQYDFYGKYTFGYIPSDYEVRSGTDGYKYSFNDGLFAQFASTGSEHVGYGKTWYTQAKRATRAMTDSCILHGPNHYSSSIWRGGCIQHTYHDQVQIDGFLRELGTPVPDLAFGIGGLNSAYVLYDDPRAQRAIDEYASHVLYRWDERNEYGSFIAGGTGAPTGREYANALRLFVEAYQATGQEKYFTAATELVTSTDFQDREGYYLSCANAGACTEEEIDFFETTYSASSAGTMPTFWKEMMLPSLGMYLDVSTQRGEENSAGYLAAQEALNDRAAFFHEHVIQRIDSASLAAQFTEDGNPTAATFVNTDGIDSYAYVPYNYWLNGVGGTVGENTYSNQDVDTTAFRLFGIAGLAYAYKYTGNTAYLTDANDLYITTAQYPFTFDWDTRTYSQIKEAGKWAEYGRYYLGILSESQESSEPDPEPDPDPTPSPDPEPDDPLPPDSEPAPTDEDPPAQDSEEEVYYPNKEFVRVQLNKKKKAIVLYDTEYERTIGRYVLRQKKQRRAKVKIADMNADGKIEIVYASQRKGLIKTSVYTLDAALKLERIGQKKLVHKNNFFLRVYEKRVTLRGKNSRLARYQLFE